MNPSSNFRASLSNFNGTKGDPASLKQYMGDYYPDIKYCSLSGLQSNGVDCPAVNPKTGVELSKE